MIHPDSGFYRSVKNDKAISLDDFLFVSYLIVILSKLRFRAKCFAGAASSKKIILYGVAHKEIKTQSCLDLIGTKKISNQHNYYIANNANKAEQGRKRLGFI